jgi:hypothetical protein
MTKATTKKPAKIHCPVENIILDYNLIYMKEVKPQCLEKTNDFLETKVLFFNLSIYKVFVILILNLNYFI